MLDEDDDSDDEDEDEDEDDASDELALLELSDPVELVEELRLSVR